MASRLTDNARPKPNRPRRAKGGNKRQRRPRVNANPRAGRPGTKPNAQHDVVSLTGAAAGRSQPLHHDRLSAATGPRRDGVAVDASKQRRFGRLMAALALSTTCCALLRQFPSTPA